MRAGTEGSRGLAPPVPRGTWPAESVRSENAVARELEVLRVEAAAGAVDPSVARLLHHERVLGTAALARLVHPQTSRHDLQEAGGRATAVGVGAEAAAAAVLDDPTGVEDRSLVALAVRVPAGGIVRATGEALVEDDLVGCGGVELGDRVVDPEAGPTSEDPADVEGGVPLLVDRLAGRARQEPHARAQLRPGAVGQRLAEVRHVARVRDEAPALALEEPDLERVEAHDTPPWRPRSLVEDDHPGESLAVAVDHEDLEAGVRLVATGERADVAERGHARALEVGEGARVRAVLVPERAAVARIARRMPGRPAATAALHGVSRVDPIGAHRRAVGSRRLRVIDGIGRGAPGGGGRDERG